MSKYSDYELDVNAFYNLVRDVSNSKDFDIWIKSYYDLQPEPMYDLLNNTNSVHDVIDLTFWSYFESRFSDLTSEEVLLGFTRDIPFRSLKEMRRATPELKAFSISNEKIYTLCDSTFETKKVLETSIEKLIWFSNEAYDVYLDLGQPLDHFFYLPERKKIIIIHHEGKRIDIPLPFRKNASKS
ncbi:MAG: hypothetical protein ACFB0B_06250 [Thermonemataceae bacterium]